MKRSKIFIGLIILSAGVLTSCDHDTIWASGEVTSMEYSIPDYSKLEVSNAFNTYVTFSDSVERIRIEANDNLHDKIIVKRNGNSLVIRLKNFTNLRGNSKLNAYITTKSISEFEMSGASRLTLENEWIVQTGTIELSGASDFTGEISADRLELDLAGASETNIYGSVGSMYANMSGSSDVRDYDLKVERLNIEMSGASKAYLSVSELIDIEASGASELHYKGTAEIGRKELSGASEIKNRN